MLAGENEWIHYEPSVLTTLARTFELGVGEALIWTGKLTEWLDPQSLLGDVDDVKGKPLPIAVLLDDGALRSIRILGGRGLPPRHSQHPNRFAVNGETVDRLDTTDFFHTVGSEAKIMEVAFFDSKRLLTGAETNI